MLSRTMCTVAATGLFLAPSTCRGARGGTPKMRWWDTENTLAGHRKYVGGTLKISKRDVHSETPKYVDETRTQGHRSLLLRVLSLGTLTACVACAAQGS
eukprot:362278-Chlamydomonas_euryale.AAC.2